MKKEIWLIIILAIMIVILGTLAIWPLNKPANNQQNNNQQTQVPQGNDGIEITSPIANTEVSSPLKITGKVMGNGWTGFEGQVGTVELLDYKGNVLVQTYLPATTEWTTLPVNFEATLNFSAEADGPGTLVFKNENASGEPSRDKTFTLPIKIKQSSGETTTVKVYFNNQADMQTSCTNVVAVSRQVPKTTAVARTALEELFKGSTQTEKNAGLFTNINTGVKINSLTIDASGTAKADFSQELESPGGSCRVSAIRAQITQTLKQFPTIKNVIISINGNSDTILQP